MLHLCFYISSFYFCSCILSYVIFYAFNIISWHFNYNFVSRILNFLHIFVKHVMCQIYYDDGSIKVSVAVMSGLLLVFSKHRYFSFL